MHLIRLILPLLLVLAVSCGPRPQQAQDTPESPLTSEAHQAFFNNLSQLCGQSFRGEQVFRSHHAEGWAHLDMLMHVTICESDQIHIPFHVGDDTSRTWLFLVEDGRLRFRHDHRHPDGTPEDETLYGGYADEHGTAFLQHFPADEYTGILIDGGEGNVWTIEISEDFSVLSYQLERDGEKRLQINFDLTQPIH
jgi:hypothetical protein